MFELPIAQIDSIKAPARPRLYKAEGDAAVLVLHGYTGHPGDMDYLGQQIHEKLEITVNIPRLPGHGTNRADFQSTGARDWLRGAVDSYLWLQTRYSQIDVVGLSMGGLLALQLAAGFDLGKLVLIAPALYVVDRFIAASHLLRLFKVKLKQDSYVEEPEQSLTEAERQIREDYHRYHYTPQLSELHKLMLVTRKKLAGIAAPTLVVASEADGVVPLKAARQVKAELSGPVKLKILKNSPHVINNGPEKEECAAEIIEFLEQ
ncbi:MAG: alpha/beta hydrolase [Bacillota bacterium]